MEKITSREIVKRCLKFENPPRIPIDLWTLPWAEIHLGKELKVLQERFPNDLISAPDVNDLSTVKGNCYAKGIYIDEWGCIFKNIHEGIIGEVQDPVLPNITKWEDFSAPHHILPKDENRAIDIINNFCASTDLFVKSACFPRPWERYQFIRGTENALIDPMLHPKEFKGLLGKIHNFYMEEMRLWSRSDVDALVFIDDWGTQQAMLIDPEMWRTYFKPLYQEYCDLAHSTGKFIFMHSDGNIREIIPDLVEIGVDALNSQLFVMDMEKIAQDAKGKITFWGEIDRQHALCSLNPQDATDAVKKVSKHLFDPSGGIIAQFEYGPGIVPLNATRVFEEWEKIGQKLKK